MQLLLQLGRVLFGWVFSKNLSFKNSNVQALGGRASPQVYLLVNLFSTLYVAFILQWIAFIFGRNKEVDM